MYTHISIHMFHTCKYVCNRFDTLKDEEPSIEKMNTVLREAMDTIQNQTQKPTIEKSIEDTEIENLDKKRKELSPKTNKTPKKTR